MTTRLLSILAAIALSATLANAQRGYVDPYTRVGLGVKAAPPETMADKIARQEARELEAKRFDKKINAEIAQVHRNGLVLRHADYNVETKRWVDYFLVGHPKQSSLTDGEVVTCRACRDGVYRGATVLGGSKTLQRWVYSGPVDQPPVMTPPPSTAPQDSSASDTPPPRKKPARGNNSPGH